MTNSLHDFINGLPKAELHLHLEGSLEPELMFSLAKKNKIQINFSSVEEVKKAYQFSNLQDFLDIYYQGMNVLQTEQDFYDLTMAYCSRVAANNTKHVEVFYDPQGHTQRGVSFATVTNGILRGLDTAKQEFGMTSKLIMSFLRHLSEEDAFKTFEEAQPFLDRIIAVGLDSSEVGNPPSKFTNIYRACKKAGLLAVAHAGEEGPPKYIWEALDILDIERLDHGNRCLEDPKLVQRLVSDKIALTVCPLSNLKLCVVNDLKNHPIKKMLNLGLRATINSDDPSYFGGYINDNYIAIADALNLNKEDLKVLAKNSFLGSFLSEDQKANHIAQIDEYSKNQVLIPAAAMDDDDDPIETATTTTSSSDNADNPSTSAGNTHDE